MDFSSLTYFKTDIREIELVVAVLTFITAAFFGSLVLYKNPKSWTNRLFAILVLIFNSYTVINFISLHPPTPDSQIFWIRIVMAISSFMGPLLLLFVHTFPRENISLRPRYLGLILSSAFITAVLSIFPFVFKSLSYVNGEPLPVPGPAISIFLLDFAGLILLSFVVLIFKYRKSIGAEKAKQLYLMSGILLSFTLIGIVTIISIVIFKTASFVFLGPILFIILIGFIASAIVKHQLFEIKIIATNVLIVIIWAVLFSKIFGSNSFSDFITNVIIMILVVVFGIFLSHSVKKEVAQREKLEILTKELETTNQKLKELDKLKSEFLSFASHQVKAPMTAIKGFASLIIDGNYGQVSDKVKEVIGKIKDSTDRMIMLVNNLLDLRRIEEGRMDYKFEETNIFKLVLDIIDEFKPLAQKKGLTLKFDAEPLEEILVNIDPQKFGQAVQNLIENGIKYTEKGGIDITINKEGNDSILINIADSGRGISKELLPNLFEQYKRDESLAKQIEGTGLGLYIARVIVLAHKGKIWAESEGEGKGSKFFIKLPVS